MTANKFVALQIAVLTISDTRTEETDKSGKLLVNLLTDTGHNLYQHGIVKDDIYDIREQLCIWIAAPIVQVVLTTGGTGVAGRDGTPEAIKILFDKEITGFGEIFRELSYQQIGTSSLQSRALAGVANGTYIFILPGSPGACRLAWEAIISAQLDHRTHPCNLVELMPKLLA